ncbi:MAG: flagellar protein FlaG [Treponema sp.]|nr:flagellar protein FlaG [Treponema sp.]
MSIQFTTAGIHKNFNRDVVEKGTLLRRNQAQSRTAERKSADSERATAAFNKKLKITVDHQSHEVIVKVIDLTTDKVIKVLPPEELRRLHRRIKETIGFLFDQRV